MADRLISFAFFSPKSRSHAPGTQPQKVDRQQFNSIMGEKHPKSGGSVFERGKFPEKVPWPAKQALYCRNCHPTRQLGAGECVNLFLFRRLRKAISAIAARTFGDGSHFSPKGWKTEWWRNVYKHIFSDSVFTWNWESGQTGWETVLAINQSRR